MFIIISEYYVLNPPRPLIANKFLNLYYSYHLQVKSASCQEWYAYWNTFLSVDEVKVTQIILKVVVNKDVLATYKLKGVGCIKVCLHVY